MTKMQHATDNIYKILIPPMRSATKVLWCRLTLIQLILSLLLIFFAAFLSAQEWSAPVSLSCMDSNSETYDYCIDSQGIIHVVWAQMLQPEVVVKIMYSNSVNCGQSWTEPVIISEENGQETLMRYPRITVDSQDNLHVLYDYHAFENNKIHYRICTNGVWGPFIDVVPEYEGIMTYDFIVDNNDKVYVFFILSYFPSGAHYCTIENGVLSPMLTPYVSNDQMFSIRQAVVDHNNNLHCIGSHTTPGSTVPKAAYYFYNSQADSWEGPTPLGTNRLWWGYTIGLDNNDNPHLAWEEYIPSPTQVCYTSRIDGLWNPVEIITTESSPISIVYKDSTQYLISYKRFFDGGLSIYNTICYTGEDWNNGEMLTNAERNGWSPRLVLRNNILYFLYTEKYANGTKLFYLKTKVFTTPIHDNTSPNLDGLFIKIAPNPFTQRVTINYKLDSSEIVLVKLYNVKGQEVICLANGRQKAGSYSLNWDGIDKKGHSVVNGIYFCRITTSKGVVAKSLVLIK